MSKSGQGIFFSLFRRVRAASMTQRRVEHTRDHFWTFSPVSVNDQTTNLKRLKAEVHAFKFFWLFCIRITGAAGCNETVTPCLQPVAPRLSLKGLRKLTC